MSKLAIIAGTGFKQIKDLEITATQPLETPFGKPSALYVFGMLSKREIIFLARHGSPHTLLPHKINYRANIWGLKKLGITDIVAIAAVGSINKTMPPAHIVIPNQIIDYSYERQHTFADKPEKITHIDFTFPYNEPLRARLIHTAKKEKLSINSVATYGCTQGPRLETAAEILRMERDGCDLVGMTGMPEAALAKELNINYASINVVANWAAGKSKGEITMTEIEQHLKKGMQTANKLLAAFVLT